MIAILLATYNSDLFLREQIDSLLLQSIDDFSLYIHDDGSTDTTLEIIKDYITKHSNIVFLEDTIKNRGACSSFMWLLESVEADYYMFCDHDDYWLPNKIELTLDEMKRCEAQNPNRAIVVNTDLEIVDTDLNIIAASFWTFSKINRSLLSDLNYLSVYNAFTGCTMMLNQKAKDFSLPISDAALMHDVWVALKVVAGGGILSYVNQATIKYRQHDSNVVGAVEVGSCRFLSAKIKSIDSVIRDNKKYLLMVRSVRKCSVIKYLYYKLLYYIKR